MRPFLRLMIAAIVLIVLIGWLFAAPVTARPAAQDSTPYDFIFEGPTYDPNATGYPYPGPTLIQTTPAGAANQTASPSQDLSGTLAPSFTPEATEILLPTQGRNLFGTENAEMSSARVTPPPSETPLPSKTTLPSATQRTATAQAEGFTLQSGWFLAGILVPPAIILIFWLVLKASRSGEFR